MTAIETGNEIATVTETETEMVETTIATTMIATTTETTAASMTASMIGTTTGSTMTTGGGEQAIATAVIETTRTWSTPVIKTATVTATAIERGDADTGVTRMMITSPGPGTWTTITTIDHTERFDHDLRTKACRDGVAASYRPSTPRCEACAF